MSPPELERYLHEHIPLSKAMRVSVIEIGREAVHLGAPLAPNINHRDTVFGGSAAALATLAGWSLLHTRLRDDGVSCRLVIRRGSVDYRQALEGDFTARAELADPLHWERFRHTLDRRGKARIAVNAVLEDANGKAAVFAGEFAALARDQEGHRGGEEFSAAPP